MDILDRLKVAKLGYGHDLRLFGEASDEIARLRAEVEAAKSEANRYFDSWKRMTLKARAIHIESLRYRKSMIEILDAAIDAARGKDNG